MRTLKLLSIFICFYATQALSYSAFGSRSAFINLGVAFAPGVEYINPDQWDRSSDLDFNSVDNRFPVGFNFSFGIELFSDYWISGFAAANLTYIRSATDQFSESGIGNSNSRTITDYDSKIKLTDGTVELGANINIQLGKWMLQPFGSLEYGTLRRFDRISYTSTDNDVQSYSFELKSDFKVTKFNIGIRLVEQRGYFSYFKFSIYTLSQSEQTGHVSYDGTLENLEGSKSFAGTDAESLSSFILGVGSYF